MIVRLIGVDGAEVPFQAGDKQASIAIGNCRLDLVANGRSGTAQETDLHDVQDVFLVPKLGGRRSRLLLNRIGWLMDTAQVLGVPMVAMHEFPESEGSMNQELAARLPELRMNKELICSGDRSIMTDFETLAGPVPVVE